VDGLLAGSLTADAGAWDVSEEALHKDEKAVNCWPGRHPGGLFLHGYAGFIFGSVKANASG